jgi:hypothetical protein
MSTPGSHPASDSISTQSKQSGDPTQAEIGPGFEFFLKPLVRLKDITVFDLDDSKSRPLKFSFGQKSRTA